jgi:site-specific DNA-methyltransferase (cytosine-N4-specific)
VSITYLLGDTREQIATIPDGSVSLVACSPPFIALRSYLPADHPMKHAEIGSEPDPAMFLDTLLALTAEWGRVLAPWGSIAIELGDTYSGSSGWQSVGDDAWSAGPDRMAATGWRQRPDKPTGAVWPRPKCLALVPQLYAASLAYGRNLLTGEPSPAGQWLVRNMIVWHRPNPAVGALGDKFRPSTSYVIVATRSAKRWFDLTAVRTAPKSGEAGSVGGSSTGYRGVTDGGSREGRNLLSDPAGAPPLDAWFDQHDTWTITTQPSSLAHYAMWPPKLAERLIL